MDFDDEIDNECGHHLGKRVFCAPEEVVDKLQTVLNEIDGDEQTLLNNLKEKLNCDTEACILRQPEVRQIIPDANNIINTYFKPEGPRDSNKWLSNIDIDTILYQISLKFANDKNKKFLHIPFQMIDFQKTGSELANLDWPSKYKEGYRTFGTVFNTDVSTGGGKHWFAVYADFSGNEYSIEYFNSSGELPMDPIAQWMNRVRVAWREHFDKPITAVVATRIENQKDQWNCGPYSLYYIMSRLRGTPCAYFKKNKIGDSNMQKFRKALFRKS